MTTKQAATAVGLTSSDPSVDDDTMVYLVVLRGRFVDEQAFSRPSGAAAPRGGWVTFTVDADTGLPHDYGISDVPPPPPILDRLHPLFLRELWGFGSAVDMRRGYPSLKPFTFE